MKKPNSFSSIRACLGVVKQLDTSIIPIMLGMAFFTGVNPILNTFILAFALDSMEAKMSAGQVLPYVILGFVIFFAFSVLASILRKHFTVHAWRAMTRFEMFVGDKTMKMDYPQLEDPAIYKLRDKITADRNWGSGIWGIFTAFNLLCTFFITLCASAILLVVRFVDTPFFISWQSYLYMAALVGLTALISGISVFFSSKIINEMNGFSSSRYFRLFRHFLFENGISYHQGKDVRVYNADKIIWSKLLSAQADVQNGFERRCSRLGGLNGGTKSAFKALVAGGSYLFVALLAHGGLFSLGMVFLLANTLFQFSEAFLRCVQGMRELGIASERLMSSLEYTRLPNVLYHGTLPVEKRRDYEYEIEFHDVSFKYPGSDEYALRHLNLKLNIGQRLAIVGMNGSGKTTMIKLLCRLYDPTEGRITLNGIDIKKYVYDEYMGIFGVVFQDFKLFSFPLGQNVAASAQVDTEKAESCLDKAGFGKRLHELPEGLDTSLYKDFAEDGLEISGGEAQKIALARALYKDAPFVVLDEPTAALDPIAEFDVYCAMNEIIGDKTAVFISHRLSSCRFCHDIAVFHEGCLVERGSHDELLHDREGKYHELWNAQAQYYVGNAAM